MRSLPYSLKTGTLITLVSILLTAMILLAIVMASMAEKSMIKLEIKNGIMLMRSVEKEFITTLSKGATDHSSHKGLNQLSKNYFLSAVITDSHGRIISESRTGKDDREMLLYMAIKALKSGENSFSAPSMLWDTLSSTKGYLYLAHPLKNDNKLYGAASVKINMEDTYHAFRVSYKIILLYIFLNTVVFTLVGFYLMYRILIRPINSLVSKAEDFKEGDTFYPFPSLRQNEFGRLSQAITLMIEGLEKNRTQLQRNISELEKTNVKLTIAQDEILRSEKLASVGRLASGVAHEIGNPIGTIFGYLGLLKDTADQNERIDYINRIEGEIERINRIIRDLLDFSRPSKGVPEFVSLHQAIYALIEMLKPQRFMSDITIHLSLHAEKDTVFIDPDKLKQLLLNIIMNSIDAMDTKQTGLENNGKKISIKTTLDSKMVSDTLKEEGNINIEFTDNGQGISPEELDRIFDPFFTTKDPGKGTGLGLSVTLRIVEDAGGKIKVKSQKGKGSAVMIVLPVSQNIEHM